MDYKTIDKCYRPIPFWSWNDRLDPTETAEQVHKMDAAGIGGFFMHARGGLQTEYMGDEWFANTSAAIDAANECGMYPWAYDENGWPSGFGNGIVNGKGVDYQQKYLRMADAPMSSEHGIGYSGNHYFYYEVNPFYVDTLDKKVTAAFIEAVYEPYYQRFGTKITGFFTDEPQISRNGIPWSFTFEEEYRKRYGEQILEHLEELFLPVGDYRMTRVKFWKMVTDLFSENYMKQIYDWCSERSLKFTGHMSCEETLLDQLTANGACMPHYEYMHIPGMDWLGRDIFDCLTPMQLSSAAEQLGKPFVLSETFAMCGHNVSFDELKGIYEWQLVHGINLLCQHLEGYSIRGLRKRDYPPAMYIQQPWWEVYKHFLDAMSREGMILSQGKPIVDVLVLHPQTTAWSLYDCCKNEGLDELNQRFLQVLRSLEEKHISFHLGDETILQRHGRVEDGKMTVGCQSYTYVLDCCCDILLESTQMLLQEFRFQGGKCITPEELPENPVINAREISYLRRKTGSGTVHFFVNTSPNPRDADLSVSGQRIDPDTGDLSPLENPYHFAPWGSLMVLEDDQSHPATGLRTPTVISPEGEWKIVGPFQNTITLDRCDYYFDGVLQERNGYVLNIAERANSLGHPLKIRQDFHAAFDYLPDSVKLVCETPENFRISINGTEIGSTPDGWLFDKAFQTIEISQYLRRGENILHLTCDYRQSEEVYENIRKSGIFESEKNKLAYDMEIEPIYLAGNFSIRTDGQWTELDHSALRYDGRFVIDSPRQTVSLKHLEQQGFPFFCGKLTLEGDVTIAGDFPVLQIPKKGINAVTVEAGGLKRTVLTGEYLALDDLHITGKTRIRITLINNLRNLLGPHHLAIGESYAVGPWSFYKEPCIWTPSPDWNEGYCFVETGL